MSLRKPNRRLIFVGLLLGMGLCAGCGKATKVEPIAEPVEAAVPAEEAVVAPDETTNDEAAEQETVVKPKITYTPPFPARETLFEPPKQARRSSSMDDELPNGGVMLLGFANVDAQKAVLSIDGVIAPLASGGEYAGVRVITLAPPKVVLQRGRSRWTETIQ